MRYFRNRDDDLIVESDPAVLRQELVEAEQTIRSLLRQISQEQYVCAEIAETYKKVVAKLVEVSREQASLEADRNTWRQRAERGSNNGDGTPKLQLTPEEARAIRKAVARLHHPDTGGDAERMKQWNAILDALE